MHMLLVGTVAFKARVRAMRIRDRPLWYRSLWQNGYVERLIGSIRRECMDHVIVFNAEHLHGLTFRSRRTHPTDVRSSDFGDIVAYPILADCIIGTLESSIRKRQPRADLRDGHARSVLTDFRRSQERARICRLSRCAGTLPARKLASHGGAADVAHLGIRLHACFDGGLVSFLEVRLYV